MLKCNARWYSENVLYRKGVLQSGYKLPVIPIILSVNVTFKQFLNSEVQPLPVVHGTTDDIVIITKLLIY